MFTKKMNFSGERTNRSSYSSVWTTSFIKKKEKTNNKLIVPRAMVIKLFATGCSHAQSCFKCIVDPPLKTS